MCRSRGSPAPLPSAPPPAAVVPTPWGSFCSRRREPGDLPEGQSSLVEPGQNPMAFENHPFCQLLNARGFPSGATGKEFSCNAGATGDPGSIPGSGRFPRGGHGNSLQYSCVVQSLGQEDPLEKEMATYYSILAWEIPWTEELGGLESMRSQRVGHN